MNESFPTYRAAFRFLREHLFAVLLIQVPAALLSPLEDLSERWFENAPAIAILIALPAVLMGTVVSSAGTYVLVSGRATSALAALRRLVPLWRTLVPVTIVAGVVILLGFTALILPGIYLAALYMFVPYLAVDEPGLPLTVYLGRSSRIVRRRLWPVIGIVVAVLLLMIWNLVLGQLIGDWLSPLVVDPTRHAVSVSLARTLWALVWGALIDVWISHYYLKRSRTTQET